MLRTLLLFLVLSGFLEAGTPSALYLTWLHDPTSTMTVQWHTGEKDQESVVYYQKQGEREWLRERGKEHPVHDTDLLVHVVELTGLEADREYAFKLGQNGEIFRFRTLPKDLDRPVRFVVGGDIYYYLYLFREMNQQIANSDPDFVVLGGDIAYAQGSKFGGKGPDREIKRWETFFKEWRKMVTPDGRLIPLVAVIGNHDVKGKRAKPWEKPMMFYELFVFPKEGIPYRTLDFGSYLSLFLLDTGHTYTVNGQQVSWLEEALQERSHTLFKMAIYHVAAYPSVYKYTGKRPTKIRTFWSPLFERYGVQVAFENHNHAYKRTFPIKGEKVDPDGVIYLGDGAWGVAPRPVPPKKAWYLAESKQTNCFWLITLQPNGQCSLESRDLKGKQIEEFTLKPKINLEQPTLEPAVSGA
jgi:hypothetical protein